MNTPTSRPSPAAASTGPDRTALDLPDLARVTTCRPDHPRSPRVGHDFVHRRGVS